MRAVVISDGSLHVEERANPEPGPGDVLVDVAAAGLNAADLLQRRGFYPAPPGWPADIPGLELAGVVSRVGDGVGANLVGQRVCAIVGGGGQSTHAIVPAEHLLPIPEPRTMIEAGGFAEAFVTAFDALIRQAHLGRAERVLISGAAGGVGTAAVQIAKLVGATVVAVTRDSRHHDALRHLGADETITISELDELEPVSVILELVGAANLTPALSRCATGARVVVIGVGGGSKVELDLLTVMSRRLSVTGSTLRARSRSEKAEVTAEARDLLLPAWGRGELVVPVSETFAITEVEAAYASFATPGKFGKTVLVTS